MATHLVAWVAWRCLEDAEGTHDPFRLVRVPAFRRRIDKETLRERLGRALRAVDRGVAKERWYAYLPSTTEEVLDQALARFRTYHRSHALVQRGSDLVMEDPKLCLYYRNRLAHADLET